MKIIVKFLVMVIVLSSAFYCSTIKRKEICQEYYYLNTMLKLSTDSAFAPIDIGGTGKLYNSINFELCICDDNHNRTEIDLQCNQIPSIGDSVLTNNAHFYFYQLTPPSNPDTTPGLYIRDCNGYTNYLNLSVPAVGTFEGIIPNDSLYEALLSDPSLKFDSLESKKGLKYLITDTLHDSLKGEIHIYTLYRHSEMWGMY